MILTAWPAAARVALDRVGARRVIKSVIIGNRRSHRHVIVDPVARMSSGIILRPR